MNATCSKRGEVKGGRATRRAERRDESVRLREAKGAIDRT